MPIVEWVNFQCLLTYWAKAGNKQFVAVDGKEEKQYDKSGFMTVYGTLAFSPDSKHVAYPAKEGNKWFVVIDGNESKPYDDIVEEKITFDSNVRFHYIAREGNVFI